ncbi:MAG: hypothetical protein HN413_15995 [Chloroflexi bacterium]|jgi:cell division protein FtsW (lipid II flippase)|nr:hypothetical protein [Chloroflexota bacterium]
MINWYNVAANALWIIALALALAVIGFARSDAVQRGEKLGQTLNRRGWQIALNIAGILFSLGLAATSERTWEQIVWLVMVLLFFVQIVWVVKQAAGSLPRE